MKKFIDASVFMGMHSKDESTRITCKNFFIEHLDQVIYMSLENVGKCDDIVWQFDRETQDLYYPFMDRLHTVMDIQRVEYTQSDLDFIPNNNGLSTFQELTCSQAVNDKLLTLDKDLLALNLSHIKAPETHNNEKTFPGDLEDFYKDSLVLRLEI